MRNRDGNFVPKQVKKTFQFISVRKTLTGLFSNDLFFHKFFFLRSHRLTDLYAVTGIVLILPVMNFSNDFLSRSDSRVFLMTWR